MDKEALFFKIEAWLNGALPPIEAAAFEKEIAGSDELANEVEKHRLDRDAVEHYRAAFLRAKIRDWPKPTDVKPAQPNSWRLKPAYILAPLIIVFLIGGTLLLHREGCFKLQKVKNENNPEIKKIDPEIQNTPDLLPIDTSPSGQESAPGTPTEKTKPIVVHKQKVKPVENSYTKLAILYFEDSRDHFNGVKRTPEAANPGIFDPVFKAINSNRLEEAALLLRTIDSTNIRGQEILGQVLFDLKDYNGSAKIYEKLYNTTTRNDLKRDYRWKLILSLVAIHPYRSEEMLEHLNNLITQYPDGKGNQLKAELEAIH